jgi:hypothetical protein
LLIFQIKHFNLHLNCDDPPCHLNIYFLPHTNSTKMINNYYRDDIQFFCVLYPSPEKIEENIIIYLSSSAHDMAKSPHTKDCNKLQLTTKRFRLYGF